MGQQTGILGLRGTVGGLVFAKDGSVRQKPASNKAAFASKGSMSRTRENASEFGAAGSAGKTLREALRSAVQGAKDKFMVGRLTKLMREIIALDTTSVRGSRVVKKANAILRLPSFNFNGGASLSSTFFAPYTVGLAGAVATITIPDFAPLLDVTIPQGATHVEIVAAAASIDWATGVYSTATLVGPAPIEFGSVAEEQELTLTLPAAPAAGDTTVVAMGVNFYQEVNGQMYPLNNNASNPLAIVYVG